MGDIVLAAGASHAPGITGMPEAADPEQASRFYAGMEKLRQAFVEAKPDVIIVVSNDHLYNFYLNNMPSVCIGISESYHGPFEPWLRIGERDIPGRRDLALTILKETLQAGFPIAFSEELALGHAEMVPLHFITPEMDVPIVPIMVNDFAPPLPPLRLAYRLGGLIRRIVEGLPWSERVAVLGTGGLSHWVGVPEMGRVNSEFDQRFLDGLEQADATSILELTDYEIDGAGNGMHEIRNWVTAMGAVPGLRAEVTAYEAITPWVTGCAAAVWKP